MIIKYFQMSDIHEDFDAPDLDLSIEWIDDLDETLTLADQTSVTQIEDVVPGDLFWAEVYQENKEHINLKHKVRPFLVVSRGNNRAYGFQLTHDPSSSLKSVAVPLEDFRSCGLPQFSYILPNMIRGVYYDKLKGKIGHLSAQARQDLVDKLHEIANNSDNMYYNIPIRDRLNQTIENVYKIVV